jgi:hypothetical protein
MNLDSLEEIIRSNRDMSLLKIGNDKKIKEII